MFHGTDEYMQAKQSTNLLLNLSARKMQTPSVTAETLAYPVSVPYSIQHMWRLQTWACRAGIALRPILWMIRTIFSYCTASPMIIPLYCWNHLWARSEEKFISPTIPWTDLSPARQHTEWVQGGECPIF